MKNSTININNYEAFLLDKVEGNLSVELTRELTLFLEENDIPDVNEEDLVYFDENDFRDPTFDLCLFSEDLKRYAPSAHEEEMIFEAVEGNLEHESGIKLMSWIASDAVLKQHYEAMLATKYKPQQSLVYPDKSKLKRSEPIVRYLYLLAAACVIGLLYFFVPAITSTKDVPLTVNDMKPGIEISKKVDIPLNEQRGIETQDANTSSIIELEKGISDNAENNIQSQQKLNAKINPKYLLPLSKQNDNSLAQIHPSKEEKEMEILQNIELKNENRVALTNLPRIAKLGSERVLSNVPKSAIINNYQSRRAQEDSPLLAGAVNSIKDKIDFVDRKSAAIYGFADFQKNIIQSEGLFEVSKDRNSDGKVEGYSFRIAGFELSTAK